MHEHTRVADGHGWQPRASDDRLQHISTVEIQGTQGYQPAGFHCPGNEGYIGVGLSSIKPARQSTSLSNGLPMLPPYPESSFKVDIKASALLEVEPLPTVM